MTREANVWLNGSEVNTQQMGEIFAFPPPPSFQEIWFAPLAEGTQGYSSPSSPLREPHFPPTIAQGTPRDCLDDSVQYGATGHMYLNRDAHVKCTAIQRLNKKKECLISH